MPTYEYECTSCPHTFDAFQSISETPIKTCPRCGKEVRRDFCTAASGRYPQLHAREDGSPGQNDFGQ